MKNENRKRKRRLIYKIVDMFYDLDGSYDQCPPDEVDREARERLDDKILHYLLVDDHDRDLKEEVLTEMLSKIMARSRRPKTPTPKDLDFLESVTGVRPDEEELQQYVQGQGEDFPGQVPNRPKEKRPS